MVDVPAWVFQVEVPSIPYLYYLSCIPQPTVVLAVHVVHTQVVDVPAWVFQVDVPDMYYRGVVMGADPGHAGAVVLRLHEAEGDNPATRWVGAGVCNCVLDT